MISIDTGIHAVECCIHLCMHPAAEKCRIIECKADIIAGIRNIHATHCCQLRCVGQIQKIKNSAAPQCLS